MQNTQINSKTNVNKLDMCLWNMDMPCEKQSQNMSKTLIPYILPASPSEPCLDELTI